MTPRPTRLALLISLMGIGLSATGPAWADEEAERAAARDVERVMRVLGLDTGVADTTPVARRADPRPRPVVAARAAPRRWARDEVVARPEPAPVRVEETTPPHVPVAMPPADPEPPTHPVDLALAAPPTTRPVDDPEPPPPELPWVIDALPPPEPPLADADAGQPVAELADGIDAYEALIQKLAAGDDPVTSLAQAERVMRQLASLREADLPVLDDVVEEGAPPVTPTPRLAPRAEYVQARLAAIASAEEEALFAAPSDRVLGDLAAMMGRVLEDGDTATETAAVTAPEPDPSARVLEALAEVRGAPWDGEALAMDKARLDTMRGGFTTDTGLKLSFGIERAVYINGNLVTTTSLNVSDLGAATAGRAASATVNGSLALVQSGTGNTFLPGAVSSTAVGTVIQNTLDNQKIQHVTTLNATVNSMQVLRAMNLQHAVRTAITDSIRR